MNNIGNYLATKEFVKGETLATLESKFKELFSACHGFINLEGVEDFFHEDENENGNTIVYPSKFNFEFDKFFGKEEKEITFDKIYKGIEVIGNALKAFNDEEIGDFLFARTNNDTTMSVAVSLLIYFV